MRKITVGKVNSKQYRQWMQELWDECPNAITLQEIRGMYTGAMFTIAQLLNCINEHTPLGVFWCGWSTFMVANTPTKLVIVVGKHYYFKNK